MPRKMSKEENRTYMRWYMRERYRRLMHEAIISLGGRCVRCGAGEDLDIDHVENAEKVCNASMLARGPSKKFWEEIKKCQLLCKKCHQEKTLVERGQKRNKGVHGNAANYQKYGCRCDLCREAANRLCNEWRWRTGRRKKRHSGVVQ